MADYFYLLLDKFKSREGIFYTYFYKVLKVIINILFPIFYKSIMPKTGKISDLETVVSFTSFPERIGTAWVTAFTLLNQSIKPTHTILWLADSQFPGGRNIPRSLLRLKKYGLEIRFCEDIKSHKKYYYSMKEYPNAVVVIADDDVFYPSDWLEKLIDKYRKYPNCICCYWAHEITLENGIINKYEEWISCIKDCTEVPSDTLMAVGYGGVLYPPKSLDSRVFHIEDIRRLCITADDLWLKAMSYLNGYKTIQVNKNPVKYFSIITAQKISLFDINVGKNGNNQAIQNILSSDDRLKKFSSDSYMMQ